MSESGAVGKPGTVQTSTLPRVNLSRYHGGFGPNSKLRALPLPQASDSTDSTDPTEPEFSSGCCSTGRWQHLGHDSAHDAIIGAIENVIREGDHLTPDIGGTASCEDYGSAIAARLSAQ